jgi:hypothetical protein
MSLGKSILAGIGVELDEEEKVATPIQSVPPRASMPPSAFVATPSPAAPVDQDSLDALTKQIFPAPDNYTLFRDLHQELGGQDVARTLSILTKANPGISVQKIKADIGMALDRVGQQRRQFGQEIEKAKASRVDAAEAEIVRLNAKIADDANEIGRLQAEISASQQQIAASQAQKQQAQAAIADGQTRFEAVVQRIEQPLQQAQATFSNIQ